MREFLSRKDIPFQQRDFFETRLSNKELRFMLGNRSPSDVFSSKSPSARALHLKVDELTDREILDWIIHEPRLMRRPIVKIEDNLIIGANWEDLEKHLG